MSEQEWISVDDRLPEGRCLVLCESRQSEDCLSMHTAEYMENATIVGNHFDFDMPKVTHWQPLPEPPKEG